MMQFLLYSKHLADQITPTLVDIIADVRNSLPEEITSKGTVCLTTGLVFESLRNHFAKAGFFDCGRKGEKIDLKRALRFDGKKNRELPKQLVFSSTSIGAFKRGFYTFFEKHFTPADPPCLIIIHETIFDTLMREGVTKQKKAKQNSFKIQDSIFNLMNIPEINPVMEKLKLTYIGDSAEVQHTRALIFRASQTDSPVLILGETGTGKDVIANQIYEFSVDYKKGPFTLNCAALPETLLEGELFGYVKGSYTGADKDKKGLFEEADGGTIFLDEIGDLSLANQVKILQAVENKGFRRIGSNKTINVNVRIIAATNRNLFAMMRQGLFREDLYYRLNTILIKASPLREHPDDIPVLAKAYWKKKNRKGTLTSKFLNYLKTYSWPGNVRELNALLNSIADHFGDISPTPEHVEAIRKWRQEELVQAISIEKDDPSRLLKIKSQQVLIAVQNILRSIKIELHRVINKQTSTEPGTQPADELMRFISGQIVKLNELCLEPAYFIRWEIFKKTEKYIHVLNKIVRHWPETSNQFLSVWTEELQKNDDEINQGIMDMVWGKIDM